MSNGYHHTTEFTAKSERTAMSNPPHGVPVQRINDDCASSESDNTSFYVPKGSEGPTSLQPQFELPHCNGAVRNLAVVVMTESANSVDRERCLAQLRTMAHSGDEQAQSVLRAFDALGGLSLD